MALKPVDYIWHLCMCGKEEAEQETIAIYKRAADRGDLDAQVDLAESYLMRSYRNVKASNDRQEGLKLLLDAAHRQCPKAFYFLGKFYYFESDKEESLKHFRKAADLNYIPAFYSIALFYKNGWVVGRDIGEAIMWYQKGADAGHCSSQNDLAMLYFASTDIDTDFKKAFSLFLQAAEQGDDNSQLQVGFCYENGMGCKVDVEKAIYWYRKSARQNNWNAELAIAQCYEQGVGVQKDISKAIEIYKDVFDFCDAEERNAIIARIRNLADSGIPEAQVAMGDFCADLLRKRDYNSALAWYQKAADQGYMGGLYKLAYCYDRGEGVPKNQIEAKKLFSLLVDNSYVPALLYLAERYWYGSVGKRDRRKSVSYYEKAARCGDSQAELELGRIYRDCFKNPKKGFKWVKLSAEHNNVTAQHLLGVCYENGEGVRKNKRFAFEWYQRAADNDHRNRDALYELGRCYEYEIGVKRNAAKAARYYFESAKLNSEYACFALSCCFEFGIGVGKSKAIALIFLKEAAWHGHREAQYLLGKKYEVGDGVKKDLDEAISWYQKAAEYGHRKSKRRLKELDAPMNKPTLREPPGIVKRIT